MWVDILDLAGNKQGPGPLRNIESFETTARFSKAGEWRISGIATDARTQELILDETAQRYAMAYDFVQGEQIFIGGGPIHERILTGSPDKWTLEIGGPDLLGELTYITVGQSEFAATATGVDNLSALLDFAPPSWATAIFGTVPQWSAKFSNETLINALASVAEKLGGYFTLDPTGTFGRVLKFAFSYVASGIIASANADPVAAERNPDLCLITGISEKQDAWDVINEVKVYGAGVGENRLNMASATVWPDGSPLSLSYMLDGQQYVFNRTNNTITNNTSVAAYGLRQMQLPFKDVRPNSNSNLDVTAAANYLVLAAMVWLSKHSRVEKFYDLSVAGLRQVVNPGQTIGVQVREYVSGRKPIDIDAQLVVLEAKRRWDATGHFTTGLQVATVGRRQTSAVEILADNMGKSIVMEAHPQMGPGLDTITYREHLDDDHNAHCYFFLAEEITAVNECVVRMRVDPLRSTMKSVATTGTTIGNEGAHTHPVPDHQHRTVVAGVGGAPTPNLHLDVSGGTAFLQYAGTLGVNVNLNTTPVGGSVVTSDAGSTHTHTFTPTITPVYGVFDDSAGNTYLATDLDYRINGGSWVAIVVGNVISGATGWYGLEITASVADSITGRPLATVFDVEFRVRAPGALKKAQITAQIERRVVVQSIATF